METPSPKNFLMIMVDQLRYPQRGYGDAGFAEDIKKILSLVERVPDDSPYAKAYPGFRKLAEHAVVLTDHTIAESACIPSRAAIMTGQYGPRTGVTQTDGLFKSGDARNFPWLRADGAPTIGDWFRAAGYETHYFGKWHVSDPPAHTLEGFGFADWEASWPEPHGALINNLGSYRDYQFADLACAFLRARGLGYPYDRAVSVQAGREPLNPEAPTTKPFFAVCSFTNPHDIAAYPGLPRQLDSEWDEAKQQWAIRSSAYGKGNSVTIPEAGGRSRPPIDGSFRVPLNPAGLPQDCARPSPSQGEDLLENNKPRAQFDYSYKLGLGLAAKTGLALAQQAGRVAAEKGAPLSDEDLLKLAVDATLEVAVPFQLQDKPGPAGLGFLQYYAYMISMVDRHILRVLEALEDSGLGPETMVVFVSDHGEYGAAHSLMMEKWHGAYQEAIAAPVAFRHPSLNPDAQGRAIAAQTSHIDLLPTLLGLAGIDDARQAEIRRELSMSHQAAALPGADLSGLLRDPSQPVRWPDGRVRAGVMFVTDDMITQPLPRDDDAHNVNSWHQYEVYAAAVERVREQVPALQPGAVVQPCHVRALRSGPWKLVRYCDPWSEAPVEDQWELYNLEVDAAELHNLLRHDQPFPTPIAGDALPPGLDMSPEQIAAKARELGQELARQEAALLSPYPAAHPTARPTAGGLGSEV